MAPAAVRSQPDMLGGETVPEEAMAAKERRKREWGQLLGIAESGKSDWDGEIEGRPVRIRRTRVRVLVGPKPGDQDMTLDTEGMSKEDIAGWLRDTLRRMPPMAGQNQEPIKKSAKAKAPESQEKPEKAPAPSDADQKPVKKPAPTGAETAPTGAKPEPQAAQTPPETAPARRRTAPPEGATEVQSLDGYTIGDRVEKVDGRTIGPSIIKSLWTMESPVGLGLMKKAEIEEIGTGKLLDILLLQIDKPAPTLHVRRLGRGQGHGGLAVLDRSWRHLHRHRRP
jgi:hypothetical protein